MAKLTIGFGILLILLGIFGFVATGSAHPTALIPVGIGVLFIFFGVMANSADTKKRMLWMHISVTVALLVFLGMIPAMWDVFRISRFSPTAAAAVEDLRPVLRPLVHQCASQPSRVNKALRTHACIDDRDRIIQSPPKRYQNQTLQIVPAPLTSIRRSTIVYPAQTRSSNVLFLRTI
jgi:hypothetical protein